MAWSGGTFSRVRNWQADKANSIGIEAAKHDEEDDNLAAGINQTINKDGSNAFTGDVNVGSNKLLAVAKGTNRTDGVNVEQVQDGEFAYAVDTGAANVYAIALSPSPNAYAAGQVYWVKITNANTAASTLNVNSLGAVAIKKPDGEDVASGDLPAGAVLPFAHDGTVFRLSGGVASLVVKEETQTATAGQTVFNLTTMTYTPGVANLAVYVNGVRQYPTAYTETSASRVTFASGLTVGDVVLFEANRATTITTMNASGVTYDPSGTGAVSRSVESVLREAVSVKDFGAVGDGVTDDSTAFTNAFAASDSVVVPPGTYLLSSLVNIPSGQSLEIQRGAVVKGAFYLPSPSKIRIFGGGEINGPQTPGSVAYVSGETGITSPSQQDSGSNVVIEGISMTGWGGGCIRLEGITDAAVRGCHLEDIAHFGVFMIGCPRGAMQNNYVKDVLGGPGASPFLNGYGLCATTDASWDTGDVDGVVMSGNRVENVLSWKGLDFHGINGGVIEGNTVKDCMIGIAVVSATGSFNRTSNNVTISSNSVENVGGTYKRAGILLSPSYSVGSVYGDHFVIADNVVKGHGRNAATLAGGYSGVEGSIEVVGCLAVTVSGNSIAEPYSIGIHLEKRNLGVTVVGNTISDPKTDGVFQQCLRISENNTVSSVVDGNLFQRTSGSVDGVEIVGSPSTTFGVRWGVSNQFVGSFSNEFIGTSATLFHADTPRAQREGITSIASAATITIPAFGEIFDISGTTGITSITASWEGRKVTLHFAGALTVTDGSNLKLSGNFVTTADDTLTLYCDGTDWREISRSVN